jgi:FkbM family methyltransferase
MNDSVARVASKGSRGLRMSRSHPDLLATKIAARVRRRIRTPSGTVDGKIGGVRFRFEMELDVRVAEMYRKIHSMEVVHALRHLLKAGDVFVDVGANIGFMSAVAADQVGRTGRVVAFEPVPMYAARVARLAHDNPEYEIDLVPKAVGDSEGRAPIDVSAIGNIGWNTMVPGLMPDDHRTETHDVEVVRLDKTLAGLGVGAVSLVKIDVEGFELSVLRSMDGLWRQGHRPAILCELDPAAIGVAGGSTNEVFELIDGQGYQAVDLLDLRTPIDLLDSSLGHGDVLFIPSGRDKDARTSGE